MNNGCVLRALFLAAGIVGMSAEAHAATIVRTFTFTGTSIANISGSTASPVSSVSLTFTVEFDPTLSYASQTSGLTLDSYSLSLSSPFAFTYAPGSSQRMTLGGTANGVFGIFVNNDDFTLDFTGAGGATPQVSIFQFATSGTPGNGYRSFTNTLTLTDLVTPVPEPASWALMIAGFGLAGAAMRRRKSSNEVALRFAA